MQATYNLWLVTLSIGVAVLVSYTALTLVASICAARAEMRRTWLLWGALAVGIGLWSVHFIGMMAFSLPIVLRYDLPITAASLVIAMVTSGCALSIAASPHFDWRRWAAGSAATGVGICAMQGPSSVGSLHRPSRPQLTGNEPVGLLKKHTSMPIVGHARRNDSEAVNYVQCIGAYLQIRQAIHPRHQQRCQSRGARRRTAVSLLPGR